MKHKIDYLFSRSDKIGSRVISWSSSLFPEHILNLENNKIPSHVAILIDDFLVIESTLSTGVRTIPLSEWLKHNELLYKVKYHYMDIALIKELLFEMYSKKYDWLGICYFGICMLNHYFTGKPLPLKNKWERENYFFCTEFAARLDGYNYSMTTPAKMCSDFLQVLKTPT